MILGKARTPRGCPDIFKNFIKILKPVARSRIASVLVIAFVMPRNKRNRNDIAFTPDLSANSLAHKRAKAAENRLARAQKIGNRGGFVYFLHILIIIFTKLFHDIYYLIYCPICCMLQIFNSTVHTTGYNFSCSFRHFSFSGKYDSSSCHCHA